MSVGQPDANTIKWFNYYGSQYGVPTALWENLVSFESNFNPNAIGDGPAYGGYSYGLLQLHVATKGGAQGNTVLNAGHSIQDLYNPQIQAQYGMPSIGQAWQKYGPSFSNTYGWWEQFLAASGHPGGGPNDPVTQNYTKNFMALYNQNLFGSISTQNAPVNVPVSNPITDSVTNSLLSGLGLPTPESVKQTFTSIAIFVAGALLVTIGVLVLFFHSDTGKETAGVAAKAAMA